MNLKEIQEVEVQNFAHLDLMYREAKKMPNGVTFKLFFTTILIMSIVVSLAVIKIYLANQIYYESRRINYIQRELSALKEENVMLQNQLQAQKFKNCVSDVNFYSEFNEEEEEN